MVGQRPRDHATATCSTPSRARFPAWRVCVQIMPEQTRRRYRCNPFDLTKVWPHADYPLIEVGLLVLNRNPENYFADVEQSAFSPGNFVPGIGFSPDKMLQAGCSPTGTQPATGWASTTTRSRSTIHVRR